MAYPGSERGPRIYIYQEPARSLTEFRTLLTLTSESVYVPAPLGYFTPIRLYDTGYCTKYTGTGHPRPKPPLPVETSPWSGVLAQRLTHAIPHIPSRPLEESSLARCEGFSQVPCLTHL